MNETKEKFLALKEIRLIREDFNTLDTESLEFSNQYSSNFDCMIARALKREGFETGYREGQVSVAPYTIQLNTEKGIEAKVGVDGGERHLKQAAKTLSEGAEYAVITVN